MFLGFETEWDAHESTPQVIYIDAFHRILIDSFLESVTRPHVQQLTAL
jgi:hypothetical protein